MSGVKERLTRIKNRNSPETQATTTSTPSKEPGKSRFASGGAKSRVDPDKEVAINGRLPGDAPKKEPVPVSSFRAEVAPSAAVTASADKDIRHEAPCAGLDARNIPPGSQFSLEQWSRAWETAAANEQVVVEMLDAQGSRLASIPLLRTHAGKSDDLESKLLGGSMLIEKNTFDQMDVAPKEDAKFVFRDWAHKECTPAIYMVIRNAAAIEKMPWLSGIVWNNMEPDASTSEYERQNRSGSPSRGTPSNRFSAVRPRG